MTGEKEPTVEARKDPEVLEELYVIDFDRTLVDSTRLGLLLLDAVDTLGVDSTDLREQLELKHGGSLQLLSKVEQKLGPERMDELKQVFRGLAEEARTKKYKDGGFFEPGAHYLLGSIPSGRRMIFTYGDDETWQEWKLEAAGLINQQYAITTEKGENGKAVAKPQLLSNMRREDGVFAISNARGDQPTLAKRLVMVDDKPENLTGLPEGVTAYLYYPKHAEKEFKKFRPKKFEDHKQFIERNPNIRRLKKLRQLIGNYAIRR